METILTEIIELLTSGLVAMGEGIGGGLNSIVTSMFITTGEGGAETLSTFGGVIIIFTGVALAIGLTRFVTNWLTSLGN